MCVRKRARVVEPHGSPRTRVLCPRKNHFAIATARTSAIGRPFLSRTRDRSLGHPAAGRWSPPPRVFTCSAWPASRGIRSVVTRRPGSASPGPRPHAAAARPLSTYIHSRKSRSLKQYSTHTLRSPSVGRSLSIPPRHLCSKYDAPEHPIRFLSFLSPKALFAQCPARETTI